MDSRIDTDAGLLRVTDGVREVVPGGSHCVHLVGERTLLSLALALPGLPGGHTAGGAHPEVPGQAGQPEEQGQGTAAQPHEDAQNPTEEEMRHRSFLLAQQRP